MQDLKEGQTPFKADLREEATKDMGVFYNPVMKLNRDLTLCVLAAIDWLDGVRACLPMEASGVRAARIMNELVREGKLSLKKLVVNDINSLAVNVMRENLSPYENLTNLIIKREDANVLMSERTGYEYIDLDPFGSPNPFLDAACKRISNKGILAVTATDTAALTGTYPRVTRRKYWAEPKRCWMMHELALRILIRKVQLVAAQYEKALAPILSVSTDHYYRVFFRCRRSVNAVKEILKQHDTLTVDEDRMSISLEGETGPLWTGELHDGEFVSRLVKEAEGLGLEEAKGILELIEDECAMKTIGFIDVHRLASILGGKDFKRDDLLQKLSGTRTHITPLGIKTEKSFKDIRALF